MYNLLTAGCFRLFKSWYFRGIVLLTSLLNIYMVVINRKQLLQLFQGQMPLSAIFGHTIFIGITLAVLVGFFVGDEYSDKTLRNKIICGYDRKIIYFIYFFTCFIGITICHLTAIFFGYSVGRLMIGTLTVSYIRLLKYVLYSLAALALMCALSLLIVTIVQSKTIGIIVADVVAIFGSYVGAGLFSELITHSAKDSFWIDFLADAYLNKIRAYEDLFMNEVIEEVAFPGGLLILTVVLLVTGMLIFECRDIK